MSSTFSTFLFEMNLKWLNRFPFQFKNLLLIDSLADKSVIILGNTFLLYLYICTYACCVWYLTCRAFFNKKQQQLCAFFIRISCFVSFWDRFNTRASNYTIYIWFELKPRLVSSYIAMDESCFQLLLLDFVFLCYKMLRIDSIVTIDGLDDP